MDKKELIEKIEKLKVPQFVEDWYEEHKDDFDYNLWEYLVYWDSQEPSDFKTWIVESDKYEPLIILVNMHQFGYTVEKEPKYTVRLKGLAQYRSTLAYGNVSKTWFLASSEGTDVRVKHTRRQLEEAGFSEIFNNPMFEVTEVE